MFQNSYVFTCVHVALKGLQFSSWVDQGRGHDARNAVPKSVHGPAPGQPKRKIAIKGCQALPYLLVLAGQELTKEGRSGGQDCQNHGRSEDYSWKRARVQENGGVYGTLQHKRKGQT